MKKKERNEIMKNNDLPMEKEMKEWFDGLDDNLKTTFLMIYIASVWVRIMRQILDNFLEGDNSKGEEK